MNTPIDIALERNANRDESIQVPPAVIHRMSATLESPTEQEKYFKGNTGKSLSWCKINRTRIYKDQERKRCESCNLLKQADKV